MAEFETSWEQHGIHELQKAIEHQIVHFDYPKMHLVSHISKSIWRMGSEDNFTTDISELLHISNVKDGDRSSNKVNYT
jgi:predicted xylose isomerase-like sugar epimerase